ncbi:hypothetical protein [Clostridium sporogenes]|nr:hypothetical protein [Clostridium sporogenes]
MKAEDIEVELIMGENTSIIVTEALLKLYEENAEKVLNLNEEEK